VPALAAGLALVDAEVVVLLAADLPFVARVHVDRLLSELIASEVDGVMFVDAEGHDQPLLSAWRTSSLRKVLPDRLAGVGLRRVLAPLHVVRLRGDADLVDCDTEADLAAARARADGGDA
jgi:molybdopterin-guanine dinucleotide biosynthesis protein A